MKPAQADVGSPSTLVAIALAARKTGDRQLERYARSELSDKYGVRITLARRTVESKQPVQEGERR
jgi:hypothetical protein